MSRDKELAGQLFGQGQEQQPSIGAMEAVRDAFKEFRDHMAPGLTWDKIVGDIGHELKQQWSQGTHELAAALFNGNAFVMYPRGTRDDHGKEGHGVHGPEQGQGFAEQPEQERQQERGGREM